MVSINHPRMEALEAFKTAGRNSQRVLDDNSSGTVLGSIGDAIKRGPGGADV
jgi:hypothetical protein